MKFCSCSARPHECCCPSQVFVTLLVGLLQRSSCKGPEGGALVGKGWGIVGGLDLQFIESKERGKQRHQSLGNHCSDFKHMHATPATLLADVP